MDRHGVATVIFMLLIVADVSNASLLSKLRQLVAVASADNSTTARVSPSPSPDPVQIGTNKKSNETSSKDPNTADHSTKKVDPKGFNNTPTVDLPPQNQQNNHGPMMMGRRIPPPEVVTENCTGVPRRCTDQNSLVACILGFENVSKTWVIIVQNEGEGTLDVDLSAPNPNDNALLEIPKHQKRKMNLARGRRNEIILKAGSGECILHTHLLASRGNFFFNLPSYHKLITRVNGAYFLIATVIVFGATWMCCSFRKRRQQSGIPYQELEMGEAGSRSGNGVETAAGWDQGWDDDWDEENAVKSPAAHRAASISANGLTSRSTIRDGWDNDWDD